MFKRKFNIINEYEYEYNEKQLKNYCKYLNKQLKNKKKYSIVLIGDKQMEALNYEFRNLKKVTDVLSFEDFSDNYLGDIIISIPEMIRNSITYSHDQKRELYFLVTHGFLHLNGYDHLNEEDSEKMFTLQKKLLNNYGVKR